MSTEQTPCELKGEHVDSSWVEYDGYGIYLTRVCDSCVKQKMARFVPDIKERYEHDEPLEPDDY